MAKPEAAPAENGIITVFIPEREVLIPVGDVWEHVARRVEKVGGAVTALEITNRRLDTADRFLSSMDLSPRNRLIVEPESGLKKHVPGIKLARKPTGEKGEKLRPEGEVVVDSPEEGEVLIRRTLHGYLKSNGIDPQPLDGMREFRVVVKKRQSAKLTDDSRKGNFKVQADLDRHSSAVILRRNGGPDSHWEPIPIPKEGNAYSAVLSLEGSTRGIARAAHALSTPRMNLVERLHYAKLYELAHMGEGDLLRRFESIKLNELAT